MPRRRDIRKAGQTGLNLSSEQYHADILWVS